MDFVRAKKHLGQHFLKDQGIARQIVDTLKGVGGYTDVLEIGPGTGVLTQFLATHPTFHTKVVEIDKESVAYLKKHLLPEEKIIEGDFLAMRLEEYFGGSFGVIGNFPYNISSQIFFKILDYRDQIPEVVGMIQKEVADRLAASPGTKANGILTIFLQTYYDIEYVLTVKPGAFIPPPKVNSAVIRLVRNSRKELGCDEKLFRQVVKQGFNTRRKMLRNALKPLGLPPIADEWTILEKRAEQLSIEDFIDLTNAIAAARAQA